MTKVMSLAGSSREARRTRLALVLLAAAIVSAGLIPWVGAEARSKGGGGHHGDGRNDKLLFFAADGLRQDIVARYADQRAVPGFRDLLRKGTRASGNGLLTQAPPNTGSGWFTLTTGAWPGVHGSTNNTFHKNGDPFANSTSFAGAGVLQAETLAQAAERGGKKVAQIEWAGGRSGATDGPTVDFRNFRSGRGVVTNYISPNDSASFTTAFGLQFDHPAGFAGRAAFPQAAPAPATGWTDVPTSYSPAQEMRMRVLDGCQPDMGRQVRPQRLHLRQPRTTAARATTACCSRRRRTATTPSATCARASGRTSRSRPRRDSTDALNGKRGAMLVKVERLAADLSQVRLFHTSVTRAIATWPTWEGESGLHRHVRGLRGRALPVLAGRRLRGARGGHRFRGDLRRAGPLLGDGPPAADQVHPERVPPGPRDGRLPGHRRVPAPVPRARDASAAERRRQPGLRRRGRQRHAATAGSGSARRSSAERTRAPTPRCGSRRTSCATAI